MVMRVVVSVLMLAGVFSMTGFVVVLMLFVNGWVFVVLMLVMRGG